MTHYKSAADLPAAYRDQVEPKAGRQARTPRVNKYGNTRVDVDGMKFDSILEADYYQHLKQLWLAGVVHWFVRQVSFDLPGGIVYRADFVVVHWGGPGGAGSVEVVDCKGVITDASRIKLKLMLDRWKVHVGIVKRGPRGQFRKSSFGDVEPGPSK